MPIFTCGGGRKSNFQEEEPTLRPLPPLVCYMATQYPYDVFISFSGKDTRIEFVDYLVHSLKRANIRPFVDRYTKKGISISSQLLTAISESRSSIIVMSEKFAASKWCLIELDVILEKNRTNGYTVMPIFYKVNPSHVRNQEEKFAQALAEHEEKEDKVQVNRWKHALAEFGDLVGWVFPSSYYRSKQASLSCKLVFKKQMDSGKEILILLEGH
ncbi:hypothetical protein RJ640_000816 [Escallonia rubra]|uniref:ADP-ribosyl cyclase/cyclic ADP-ribose hydrolase n=1 Tax=Escallonia rubra TaxID=112253 RepID=A0AA88RIK6_9ASTE|nr:hypothetical protein RJ640_000816 [Escallonia rubra]